MSEKKWYGMPSPEDAEYVVYRTGYPRSSAPLEYLEANRWDVYIEETPDTKCVFISRGHTLVEAINLTKLANEGVEE